MKLETILDAMEEAQKIISNPDVAFSLKLQDIYKLRLRQYRAFRARILRMDAEKDMRIDLLRAEYDYLLSGLREAVND